jgi:uncharacterized phage protein (TIGR01671 family)
MRDIRFRAWDKKLKEMFDVRTFDVFGSMICFVKDNAQYKRIKKVAEFERQPTFLAPSEITFGQGRDIVLIQYTGLKDKNRRFIYEEDIVEYDHRHHHKKDRFIIKWRKSTSSWWLSRHYKKMQGHQLTLKRSTNCEVIGNIFENGDLLKVKKLI